MYCIEKKRMLLILFTALESDCFAFSFQVPAIGCTQYIHKIHKSANRLCTKCILRRRGPINFNSNFKTRILISLVPIHCFPSSPHLFS
ncbi:hypothetical protein GGR54DRAFT_245214 [Hypoxylon sp. NC1633]|nr:hypothetical protein GGR54DRAFT_245214 [Hypoxylon sp. NC1633]